ncbi:MAG: CCA tRNA nucleotidyltransferase [Dehalococcoidales bacterium]
MNPPETVNLAGELPRQLPHDLLYFIRKAGEVARQQQQRLYLVGGAVRDLLMERCTLDIDLIVEGDAVKMAREMAAINQASLTVHTRFGTAKLRWRNRSADVATARAETYTRPGALPAVRPGTIAEDLARRDFTVNAMAVELNPPHFGELIDPHGGRADIQKSVIRVLHEKSFIDDATRIWRAVRYEQRLDFKIGASTLALIKRDIDMLDTITGDRIRHELELVLDEETPQKALKRAGALGLLAKISPLLKGDDWLTESFAAAAEKCLSGKPHPDLYLALLFYRLTPEETEKVIAYLHFPKIVTQLLRDTAAIKSRMNELSKPGTAPSLVYETLHGYSLTAIEAHALGSGSETAAEHIQLYLNVLRHVNPTFTGDDLLKLGVPHGPKIKQVLEKLREARLDGKINTKKEELALVKSLLL